MGSRRNEGIGRLLLIIFALVVGGYVAIKLLGFVLGMVLSIVVPVAIVGGIGYALWLGFGKKALGGGRRTLP